jgi:alpha-tubulin suppressor-like RCC1 family protein/fibronectin type 3 domain-containing protein
MRPPRPVAHPAISTSRISMKIALFSWKFILAPLLLFPITLSAQGPTPGQNVNMVSGTQWPGGDPFLRQQNEPSIAVSTRNPRHLLAGANDYRTVDLNLVDTVTIDELDGDAWLGVFKSFDGGQTWKSTLLPGFPQDLSPLGASSPMKGFGAASDPVVRAGTNGMFYYSGIAFNRGTNFGGVFVGRFIDLDNKENGDASDPGYPTLPTTDPIRYLGTVEVDKGTATRFLDKPWIAVDIPRAGARTCTINAPEDNNTSVVQSFPGGNVYIAYTSFTGVAPNMYSKIRFSKSSDCGKTWSTPIVISHYRLNQGAEIAVDPETGHIFVSWRVFSVTSDSESDDDDPDMTKDKIVVTESTDGGNTFVKAFPIRKLFPYNILTPKASAMFDQNTTATEFRMQTSPTLVVDDSGVPGRAGNVYVAWAERGVGPSADARIVVSTSGDGIHFSAPMAVNNNPLTDADYPPDGDSFSRGHQFMPAMTFAGGKLVMTYYDLRLDGTTGVYTVNNPFGPDAIGQFFEEDRPSVGDPAAALFTPYVDDGNLTIRRHTMDVMVAESNGGLQPVFTTARLSRYDLGPTDMGDIPGGLALGKLEQLKVNPPNLPMFAQGTVPFMGDYTDVAAQQFVPTSGGGWVFNNPPRAPASSPVFYEVHTSNQDVVPPADGNWTIYTAPPMQNQTTSIFNGQTLPACTSGWSGDRNQNIYEVPITQGLYVSSPQNSKPLSTTLQRGFVILVQNSTNFQKYFRLSIANQPPGNLQIMGPGGAIVFGGYASFQQALPNQPALPPVLPTPVTTTRVTISAHSGAASTVFALSTNPTASITVNVNETDVNGNIISGGLSSFLVLNADGTVPGLINPDGAPSSTDINGVEIYSSNGIHHPDIIDNGIHHPGVPSPSVYSEIVSNGIHHPGVGAAGVQTASYANATMADASMSTPTATSDATYTLTNNGNTTAAFTVKLTGSTTINVPLQLAVTQTYTTYTAQTAAGQSCALVPQQQMTNNVNVINPQVIDPTSNGIHHTDPSDATVLLAPGDSAQIILRGQTDPVTMATLVSQVVPAVMPQGVSTNSTATTPPVVAPLVVATSALPNGTAGSVYNSRVTAFGGTQPYTWTSTSVDGVTLNADGSITGTPTAAGIFNVMAMVTDSSVPVQMASRTLTVTVSGSNLTFVQQPVATTVGSVMPSAVQVKATDNTGAGVPGLQITLSIGTGPAGGTVLASPNPATTATDGTGVATFSEVQINNDAGVYTLVATASNVTPASSNPFNVSPQAPTMRTAVLASPTSVTITWNASPTTNVASYNVYRSTVSNSGFSLVGSTLASTAVNGVLSFTDTAPATEATNYYVVTAVGGGLQSGNSFQTSVFVPVLQSLTFHVQPTNTVEGGFISPPGVQVLALDSGGLAVQGIAVSMTISSNPGGGTLSGHTMVTTGLNGIATFTDLLIDKPGNGYSLQASALSGAVFGESTGFAITYPRAVLATGVSTLSGGEALAVDSTGNLYVKSLQDPAGTPIQLAQIQSNGIVTILAPTVPFPLVNSDGSGIAVTPGDGKIIVADEAVTGPSRIALIDLTSLTASTLFSPTWQMDPHSNGTGQQQYAPIMTAAHSGPSHLLLYFWDSTQSILYSVETADVPTFTPLLSLDQTTAAGMHFNTAGNHTVYDSNTATLLLTDGPDGSAYADSVLEVNPANSPATVTTLFSGLPGTPTSIALKADTNQVFVQIGNSIYGGPRSGGSLSLVANGFTSLTDIVVGNATSGPGLALFAVDKATNTVYEITPLGITTPSPLPNAALSTSYGPLLLTASGGTAPYFWNQVSVDGLSLTSSGVLKGTPTSTGTFVLSAQVTDSTTPTPNTVTQPLSITVASQPPTSLAAGPVTPSSVTLNWTASASGGVAGYNVYRATASGAYTTKLSSVGSGVTTFADTTVVGGTTYYYVVRTVGPGSVESANSNEVTVPVPNPPPNSPTSLAAGPVTASSVTLNWTASTSGGVLGYNIYRATTSGGYTTTPLNSVGAGVTTFADTTVVGGITYYYVVRAVGPGSVESANSNEVPVVVPSSVLSALIFTVQPTNTGAGVVISPAVQVQAVAGTVPLSGVAITMAIGSNPSSGTLSGTLMQTTTGVNGTATFPDLSIDRAGSGYTLSATSATIGTTSNSFSITTGPRKIAAGRIHTCTLLSSGTVQCWGGNGTGQLGNGTTINSSTPVTVTGLSGAAAVVAGYNHTCALLSGGTVQCWGDNSFGQLGNGTTGGISSTPVTVTGLSAVTAIALGPAANHACALVSDGTVQCWGSNALGQLGNGNTTDSNTPVTVTGLTGATAIAAGSLHTCALLSDGTAKCWGNNGNGQLGNGTTANSNIPHAVSSLSGATAIAAGGFHTCALLSNGTVNCWGYNLAGQVGNGTTTDSTTPVTVGNAVSILSGATAIGAGDDHTCALLSGGTAQCWGDGGLGQLGNGLDGVSNNSSLPVGVIGLSGATAIAIGGDHGCALLSGGTVQCWGYNGPGQLGNGTSGGDIPTPVTVIGISGLREAIATAAGGEHTCALLSDSTVKCWGYDALADRTTNTPVAVSGLSGAKEIAAGYDHTCALLSSGRVQCWGSNSSGLGDGTTTGSSTPVTVTGLSVAATAIAAAADGSYTCALLADGTVQCWGDNSSGQLGNGTTTSSSTPVAVLSGPTGPVLSGATAIAARSEHTCALLSGGTLQCWGYNGFGQLGNGTSTSSSFPVPVGGVSGAKAIAAGDDHTCALLADGTAQCWGLNGNGQLGNGTLGGTFSTPAAVSGLSGATAIVAGFEHTCALLAGGTAQCWGYNANGQLGNGTLNDASSPAAVSGLSGAAAISAGGSPFGSDTCALLSGGTMECWGYNSLGELGDGNYTNSSTPKAVIGLVP